MTNEQAKNLVEARYKKYKLIKAKNTFKAIKTDLALSSFLNLSILPASYMSYIDGYGKISIGFHVFATIMAIFMSIPNHLDCRDERLKTLKQIRKKLKNNINKFNAINVEDFDAEVDSITKDKIKKLK